eukprot:6473493-Amphidinium_carterae.1
MVFIRVHPCKRPTRWSTCFSLVFLCIDRDPAAMFVWEKIIAVVGSQQRFKQMAKVQRMPAKSIIFQKGKAQ